jgi:hypothetical protein
MKVDKEEKGEKITPEEFLKAIMPFYDKLNCEKEWKSGKCCREWKNDSDYCVLDNQGDGCIVKRLHVAISDYLDG